MTLTIANPIPEFEGHNLFFVCGALGMFGGRTLSGLNGDFWLAAPLAPLAWDWFGPFDKESLNKPTPRTYARVANDHIFDPQQFVVFGGLDAIDQTLNDVRALRFNCGGAPSWINPDDEQGAAPPAGRFGHVMSYGIDQQGEPTLLVHGGALDFLCIDEQGQLVLGDIKTSKRIYETAALQVSAYSRALYETYGVLPKRAVIVRLCKTDPVEFEHKWIKNIQSSFRLFRAAQDLQRGLKKDQYLDE